LPVQPRAKLARNAALDVDRVIPVGRIPKTTSGKIQRRLLVEAYLDGEYDAVLAAVGSGADTLVQDGEDRSDEDPMVVELENLAAEFTKERRIGPDENLFEVGLTSLTLAEIMLALDEKYPGAVDINDLFDHPTIRELAAFLKSKTAQLRETA
jgi:acyl carrier protein